MIGRSGFRIARRVAGRVKGFGGALMHENVIGMAITAEGIERDHDLRPDGSNNLHELARDPVGIGVDEGAWIAVGFGARHA